MWQHLVVITLGWRSWRPRFRSPPRPGYTSYFQYQSIYEIVVPSYISWALTKKQSYILNNWINNIILKIWVKQYWNIDQDLPSTLPYIRAFRNLNNFVINKILKCTYYLLWSLRPLRYLLWFQVLYSENKIFHNFQKIS